MPEGMLDVGVAAKSGPIWMSVYRDDATEPLAGTAASGRTTRWISSGDGAAKLRIVAYHAGDVWFDAGEETQKILMSLHQGTWLGKKWRVFYILLPGLGLIGLCLTGLRVWLSLRKRRA